MYGDRAGPVRCCISPFGSRMGPIKANIPAGPYGPRTMPTCILRGKNRKKPVSERCACTTFRHWLLTGIRGLYGFKKPVELRTGPHGPVRYAVRSPTGYWNFGPYGARKLPGSSMWPRHYLVRVTYIVCHCLEWVNLILGRFTFFLNN